MSGLSLTVGALPERDSELSAISAALDHVRDGSGRLVLVRGGAGLGKTSLLAAAAAMASERGLTSTQAIATDLEQALPFGVAMGLLAGPLRRARAAGVELDASAELGAALLTGASDLELLTVGESAQLTLVYSLYWIAVTLAEAQPLVLLLDDAHWADRPSLRLLAYLARQIAELPIALILALRPQQAGSEQDLLEALDELPDAARLELAPLSADATRAVLAELMAAAPARTFVDCCQHATGGNPLLLRELARALRSEGASGSARDVARVREIGPEPVAGSVRAALRHLPRDATTLAGVVGHLHEPLDVDIAAELAGLRLGDADAAVRSLERAGVLVSAGGVRLAHPLIRQALAHSATEGERTALHLHAAELYAQRREDDKAATHLLVAPPGGREWAARALASAAGRALARATPERAAELSQRALAESPPPALRAELLVMLARAQAQTGDPRAGATLEQAIAARDDEAACAALLLELAWLRHREGRFDEALASAERGLGFSRAAERVRVGLLSVYEAARAWSQQPGATHELVSTLAAASDLDGRARRVALSTSALTGMMRGDDRERTVQIALAAWDGGRLLKDQDVDEPLSVRPASALLIADRFTDVETICEACLRDAGHRASPVARATWVHLRGQVLLWSGRIDEAAVDLTEAFDAREFGWGALLPFTARDLSALYMELGELDRARWVLETARASGAHAAESLMWSACDSQLGQVLLAEGQVEEAIQVLSRSRRVALEQIHAHNPATDPGRMWLIAALNRAGRVPEALALADDELGRARRWGAPRTLGLALRLRAQLASSGEERRALIGEAFTAVADSEARLEHAHVTFALASFEHVSGEESARGRLRTALELAEQVGASALAGRARTALRDAGGRARRAGPAESHAVTLTAGELRVAERASAGLSNREIAQDLFVTPKAVAFHLGNVYRKLGITGRGELAAALAAPSRA